MDNLVNDIKNFLLKKAKETPSSVENWWGETNVNDIFDGGVSTGEVWLAQDMLKKFFGVNNAAEER